MQVEPMQPMLKAPRTKRLNSNVTNRFHICAVQVEPMRLMLKASKTKRLKLKYDELIQSFAYDFNLRRYTQASLLPK